MFVSVIAPWDNYVVNVIIVSNLLKHFQRVCGKGTVLDLINCWRLSSFNCHLLKNVDMFSGGESVASPGADSDFQRPLWLEILISDCSGGVIVSSPVDFVIVQQTLMFELDMRSQEVKPMTVFKKFKSSSMLSQEVKPMTVFQTTNQRPGSQSSTWFSNYRTVFRFQTVKIHCGMAPDKMITCFIDIRIIKICNQTQPQIIIHHLQRKNVWNEVSTVWPIEIHTQKPLGVLETRRTGAFKGSPIII